MFVGKLNHYWTADEQFVWHLLCPVSLSSYGLSLCTQTCGISSPPSAPSHSAATVKAATTMTRSQRDSKHRFSVPSLCVSVCVCVCLCVSVFVCVCVSSPGWLLFLEPAGMRLSVGEMVLPLITVHSSDATAEQPSGPLFPAKGRNYRWSNIYRSLF